MSDEHFHSGDFHVLYDDPADYQPDPEHACIECGKEAALRCGCCGFPLCGMHHELGAGFCRSNFGVGGVPVCTYDSEVYVGVHPPEDTVLVTDGDADVYHLPDEEGETAPACRPAEAEKTAVSLSLATEAGMGLCSLCADEARRRHEEFKEELAAELSGGA